MILSDLMSDTLSDIELEQNFTEKWFEIFSTRLLVSQILYQCFRNEYNYNNEENRKILSVSDTIIYFFSTLCNFFEVL